MDSQSRHNALEYELLKERAGALGIAGRQLQAALDAYNQHIEQGPAVHDPRATVLLDEVASRIYALLLQREFSGFASNNIEWLQASFALPDGVLARLGAGPSPMPEA